jgi:membrane protease YdiL (CAAX protease family)
MELHKSKRLMLVGAGVPLTYQVLFTIFAFVVSQTFLPPWGWLTLHDITDALFIGCPLLAIGLPLSKAWKTIGGRGVPWMDATIAVIAGGLSILIFQRVYYFVIQLVFHIQPNFGFPQSAQDFTAFIVLVVLLGPLGEEMLFRGFFGLLFSKTWQFVLISSILWAGLHVDLIGFIPLLFTGAILALTRARTHSFYPALIIHMLINILSLVSHFST